MDKRGAETRATFVSPYLRRPIRPLNKVLNERHQEEVDLGTVQPANDVAPESFRREHRRWLESVKRALFSK